MPQASNITSSSTRTRANTFTSSQNPAPGAAAAQLQRASASHERLTKPGEPSKPKGPGYLKPTKSSTLKQRDRHDSTQVDGAAATKKQVVRKKVTLHTAPTPAHSSHQQTGQFPLQTRLEVNVQHILTAALPQLHDGSDATLSDTQFEQILGERLSKAINDYAIAEKTTDPHDSNVERQQTCHGVDGFIESFKQYIKPLLAIRDKQQLIKAIQNYQANGKLPQTVAASTKTVTKRTAADEFGEQATAYGKYLETTQDKPKKTMSQWINQGKAAADPQMLQHEMAPSPITDNANNCSDLRQLNNGEEAPSLQSGHTTHSARDAGQTSPAEITFTVEQHPKIELKKFDFSKFLNRLDGDSSDEEGFTPGDEDGYIFDDFIGTTIGDEPKTGLAITRDIATQTNQPQEVSSALKHKQFGYLMKNVDRIVSNFGVILRTAKTEQDIDKSLAISEASLVGIERKLALIRPDLFVRRLAKVHILAATPKLAEIAAQAKVLLERRALPEPPKSVATPITEPSIRAEPIARPAPTGYDPTAVNQAGAIRFQRNQTLDFIRNHAGGNSARRAANALAIAQTTAADIARIHGRATRSSPLVTNEVKDSIEAIMSTASHMLQELGDLRPSRWTRFKDRVRHVFGRPRASDIITAAKQDLVQLERFLAIPGSTLAPSTIPLRSDIDIYLIPDSEAGTVNLRQQLKKRVHEINEKIARKRNKSRYLDQLKQHVIAISRNYDQLDQHLLDMLQKRATVDNTLNQLKLSDQEKGAVTQALNRLAQLNDLRDDRAWRQNYAAIKKSYRTLPAPFLTELEKVVDLQSSIRKVFRRSNKQFNALTGREFDWRTSR